MQLIGLQTRLETINTRNMERFKSLEDVKVIYRDLIKLKDDLINFSLIGLSNEEIEGLDFIRFRTLEEIYLVEIDIRNSMGISIKTPSLKLKNLYRLNGGDFVNEI